VKVPDDPIFLVHFELDGQRSHFIRSRDSNGVPETDLVDAQLEKTSRDFGYPSRLDPSRVRTLENRAHVSADETIDFGPAKRFKNLAEHRQRFLNGHVDVLLSEGIARRREDGDSSRADGDGSLKPLDVGNERGVDPSLRKPRPKFRRIA